MSDNCNIMSGIDEDTLILFHFIYELSSPFFINVLYFKTSIILWLTITNNNMLGIYVCGFILNLCSQYDIHIS